MGRTMMRCGDAGSIAIAIEDGVSHCWLEGIQAYWRLKESKGPILQGPSQWKDGEWGDIMKMNGAIGSTERSAEMAYADCICMHRFRDVRPRS